MTEMKTLNGYEIVDAAARERIGRLESMIEQLIGDGDGENFTPVTLTNGTLTDVQSGATWVKISGTTRGYMSGNHVNFVFVNSNNEIISKHEIAYGGDHEVFDVNVTLDIPSDGVKCGVCSDCSVGNSYAVDELISCELTLEFTNVNGDESSASTWFIESFDNLPGGTYALNFTFVASDDTTKQCTAIKKDGSGSDYTVTYEGYEYTIYDRGYGGYLSAGVGDVITISDSLDDLDSEFVNWLENNAVKQ